jgi:hypothetical protein
MIMVVAFECKFLFFSTSSNLLSFLTRKFSAAMSLKAKFIAVIMLGKHGEGRLHAITRDGKKR